MTAYTHMRSAKDDINAMFGEDYPEQHPNLSAHTCRPLLPTSQRHSKAIGLRRLQATYRRSLLSLVVWQPSSASAGKR